jgi:hypothetical protein
MNIENLHRSDVIFNDRAVKPVRSFAHIHMRNTLGNRATEGIELIVSSEVFG